ncbi:MAG: tRNA lysidine(34) synthetase TilS [Arthrospira platensis PCC 7345]|uniref:tRNA lysidine(34) synthetase TilS n=1 Tax=Limnospira platensis TaxID=118562 RepID=UPI0028E13010|nr:tRNA lysidine(34) synthetase TilS [Arthrospira platensis PCC 7345]
MASQTPWTDVHAKVHRSLRSRNLLPCGEALLVAVSGGQDSMCLIRLLLDLQGKWNWRMAIAHCDHQWRRDSVANADYIEELGKIWQVPCYRLTAPQIPKTEAAAREWRYQVLGEIAQTDNYGYVVTGHTKSDRAETLLYNLIRGSGADGLTSLVWSRPIFGRETETKPILVRPLLEITRQETGEFCQQRDLQIWEDSTNTDVSYARNRIRHQLIPELANKFNPKVEQALAQTAELLRADVEYLEQQADELYSLAMAPAPCNNSYGVNRHKLKSAPLALQRRVMRRFLEEVLRKGTNFEQVEKLTRLIYAPNRSQSDPFPGGAIAQVEGEWIWLKFPPQVGDEAN